MGDPNVPPEPWQIVAPGKLEEELYEYWWQLVGGTDDDPALLVAGETVGYDYKSDSWEEYQKRGDVLLPCPPILERVARLLNAEPEIVAFLEEVSSYAHAVADCGDCGSATCKIARRAAAVLAKVRGQ